MSREEVRLATIIDVLSGLLEAVDEGESLQQALCVAVGQTLGAHVSVYIQFDLVTLVCATTCWPQTVDMRGLKPLLEHLPKAAPVLADHLLHDPHPSCLSRPGEGVAWPEPLADVLFREVLGCRRIARLPLRRSDRELRLLLLARQRDFSTHEVRLLCGFQRPLSVLDSVVRVSVNSIPQRRPRQRAFDAPVEVPEFIRGDALTRREQEVLLMLAQGMLARTIAARMHVSTRTVHKHLGNIYNKMGAHDRLAAVNHARQLGLLPPDEFRADTG
jgi:DNA-binding CsgD family transcriptional regulator